MIWYKYICIFNKMFVFRLATTLGYNVGVQNGQNLDYLESMDK